MHCLRCGADLPERRPGQPGPKRKYCSDYCRTRESDRRAMADGRFAGWAAATRERNLKPRIEQVCRFCDRSFSTARKRTSCGADNCRRAANAERTRPHVQRRRAIKRTTSVEKFTPQEIFERDGWRCGLCRSKVRQELTWPDPMSASLDHVIPLAEGGSHTRANVQCAHLVCNERKGKGGTDQLRLVG